MKKNIITSIKTLLIVLTLAAGVSYISAWTGPSAAAPQNNVAAPLNVATSSQTKIGPLVINFGNTVSPGLEVIGPIQVVDGTQALGSVLMSDASGVSHWAATSTLGISGSGNAGSIPNNIVVFDSSSSTWMVPAGVTKIDVKAWGGGGGGGAHDSCAGFGGGGGGGGYGESILTVSPLTTYTITIGNAGNGGVSGLSAGAGGNTTFGTTLTTLITANGGSAGPSSCTATVNSTPGGRATATIVENGGNGGIGGTWSYNPGLGGSSPNGGQGGSYRGNVLTNGYGDPGVVPGGGGGGGSTFNGGVGAPGRVIIEY